MPMQAPISVDVRATLREFKEEGLTSAEASTLLGCTRNQASAALSWAFRCGYATRETIASKTSLRYRYFPAAEYDRKSPGHVPLGVPRPNRKPKLRVVTNHLKPRIIMRTDGTASYVKMQVGDHEERQRANHRAASFVRKLNHKANKEKS